MQNISTPPPLPTAAAVSGMDACFCVFCRYALPPCPQYMDAATLCSVSPVSREWRKQGNDDRYWGRLCRSRCCHVWRKNGAFGQVPSIKKNMSCSKGLRSDLPVVTAASAVFSGCFYGKAQVRIMVLKWLRHSLWTITGT